MFNCRKTRPQLAVALAILAFVLCATTGVFIYNRMTKFQVGNSPATIPAQTEVINVDWESSFFPALDERTKKVGLPSLRTMQLPDGDVELRFWYDSSPDVINGFVIRRSGDSWSGLGLRQGRDRWPSPIKQENLVVPRSGWNALWKQLTAAGILVLPDSDEAKCLADVLDGGGIVVEVRAEQKYRTYRYGNPQFADCDEAKRILSIEGLIADEFNLRSADH